MFGMQIRSDFKISPKIMLWLRLRSVVCPTTRSAAVCLRPSLFIAVNYLAMKQKSLSMIRVHLYGTNILVSLTLGQQVMIMIMIFFGCLFTFIKHNDGKRSYLSLSYIAYLSGHLK